ncbi:uncharacterized protein LOC142537285 isoform X2 [Primulina tabacum]|uniref:uncharacterized protein LOC142537285 isoform X2 n=1 Tax=Primulina tabacum TaxID=48773 RepID=UPI003F59D2F1
MEGSGDTECSKVTSHSGEDERTAKDESCKQEDGGSSSNISAVEEISNKKSSVRPYVRSKMPRLQWTPDLHLLFEQAVERLGGQERATPKLVLQLMDIKGLNIAHVKSHLQMYRSKKTEEPSRGMIDHMLHANRINWSIYNPSQLHLLSSFHQRHRYIGDASWNGNGNWLDNSTIWQNTTYNKATPGFYRTLRERISSSHCSRPENLDFSTPIRSYEDSKDEFVSIHKQETWSSKSRQNPIELNSLNQTNQPRSSSEQAILRKETRFKRQARICELDLNLSLMLESRDNKQPCIFHGNEDMSLSMYSTRSSSKQIKKMKQDFCSENASFSSSLDLTL